MGPLRGIAALLAFGFIAPTQSSSAPSSAPTAAQTYRYTNRLAASSDPYLLLHAHNPVDWYPWGPEALERAKRENKPIFLSIGYSTCYWCHVAEKTLYSDPEIAKLMNAWFVNVKVDREQQPGVDDVYMLATQIMTGKDGAWPNNLFLTPQLEPFFSGSYFPPAPDASGAPAFPSVLRAIHERWLNHPRAVIAEADGIAAKMLQAERGRAGTRSSLQTAAWLARADERLRERWDDVDGGLRSGENKFPNAPSLELLLSEYRTAHDERALAAARAALDAMAYGGIHDQLGGGFHRYCPEPTWSIPHFEKTLYDNAQLLRLYAEAYALTGDAFYKSVAIDTAQYLASRLAAPRGGFFSAQDAQVNGVEGASYLWTREQIAAALGARDATAFFEAYALNKGVLRLRLPIAQTLRRTGQSDAAHLLSNFAPLRAKLLALRDRRRQPALDTQVVVGTNGLAIEALARAGLALHEPSYVALAGETARSIWRDAYDPHARQLAHEAGERGLAGLLSDYAWLGQGFLALYDVSGDAVWRERAAALADEILSRFEGENGALVTTPGGENLLVRPTDYGDMDYPSGTSASLALLLRLADVRGASRYREAAQRIAESMSGALQEEPQRWPAAVATLNEASLAAPAASPTPLFGTAAHVHAEGSFTRANGKIQAWIVLRIDAGYHVNANPATHNYLIPTSVTYQGLSDVRTSYPKPTRIFPGFASGGLDVYEGTLVLRSEIPLREAPQADALEASVAVQACTTSSCLQPATLRVVLRRSAQHE